MFFFCCDYGILRLQEVVFARPVDRCSDHAHDGEGHLMYLIEVAMLIGRECCYEQLVFPTKQVRDGMFEDLLLAMRRFMQQVYPCDEEEEVPDGDDA